MKYTLVQKLQDSIGQAKTIITMEGSSIAAGIRSVNLKTKQIYYINSKGLQELQKAQEEKLDTKVQKAIIENPVYQRTMSLKDILDIE